MPRTKIMYELKIARHSKGLEKLPYERYYNSLEEAQKAFSKLYPGFNDVRWFSGFGTTGTWLAMDGGCTGMTIAHVIKIKRAKPGIG